ncbi:protein MLP1-like [Vespula maculifrons]|uniref:Protein MLP1-like n=1 Tax=Vespula maculifrons TaxID=7453 RepID=A0ABD2CX38_VESMC
MRFQSLPIERLLITDRLCIYSTPNLTKDIKDYYQKYKILCKEVRNMKDELNEFTTQYNVDWINTNSNLINLSNVINNIKNKNTVLLSATRSAEDTLQELRNKFKQTEIVGYIYLSKLISCW